MVGWQRHQRLSHFASGSFTFIRTEVVMGKLFLLLVGLVVLELTVMIEVGSVIGALPTVGLLILTAVLGSAGAQRRDQDPVQRAAEDAARRDAGT